MKSNSIYQGLSEAEVLKSREQHGVNILTPPEKESLWSKFLEKFEDPLIRILLVAGLLSIGIACYEFFGLGHGWTVFFEPIGIFVAILLIVLALVLFERKLLGYFTQRKRRLRHLRSEKLYRSKATIFG